MPWEIDVERVVQDIARQFKACIALRGGKVLSWAIGRAFEDACKYITFCAVCEGNPPHLVLIYVFPTIKARNMFHTDVSITRKDTLDQFNLMTMEISVIGEDTYRGMLSTSHYSRRLGCAIANDVISFIKEPDRWMEDRVESSIEEPIVTPSPGYETAHCYYDPWLFSEVLHGFLRGYYTSIHVLVQTMCSAPKSLYDQHLLQFLFKYILAI